MKPKRRKNPGKKRLNPSTGHEVIASVPSRENTSSNEENDIKSLASFSKEIHEKREKGPKSIKVKPQRRKNPRKKHLNPPIWANQTSMDTGKAQKDSASKEYSSHSSEMSSTYKTPEASPKYKEVLTEKNIGDSLESSDSKGT